MFLSYDRYQGEYSSWAFDNLITFDNFNSKYGRNFLLIEMTEDLEIHLGRTYQILTFLENTLMI